MVVTSTMVWHSRRWQYDFHLYIYYGNYNHYNGDTQEEQYYWYDVISYNFQLEKSHFGRKDKYQLEWDVPDEESGTGGYLVWFWGGKLVTKMDGEALNKRGFGAIITSEPSYILLNTDMESQWGRFVAH